MGLSTIYYDTWHANMNMPYCCNIGLVPRPIPSFSMLHAKKHVQYLKIGNGPGDEATVIVHYLTTSSVYSWLCMFAGV